MSSLDLRFQVPHQYDRNTITGIIAALTNQLNLLSDGRLAARTYSSVIPSGSAANYAVGDIVWDMNPTVLGSVIAGVAGDYVRVGWVNTVAGSPGTFKELRIPVGSGAGVSSFPSFGQLTNSLAADVSLNNTSNYFDGPSVAQGSSGTWFSSGQVTVTDSANCTMKAKLWDGTTVIASAVQFVAAGSTAVIPLSGFIASPAGNLRISVNDNATTGTIKFNSSGNSKDSTISAFRLA